MSSNFNAYFQKKATPWVSYFVLIGCICITLVLVRASQQALTAASELSGSSDVKEYLSN